MQRPLKYFFAFWLLSHSLIGANENSPQSLTKSWDELQKGMEREVSKSYKSWKIDGKSYRFVVNSKKVLTVISQCGDFIPQRNTAFGCMALRELHYVSMNDLEDNDLLGGKNPGSILCKKSVKGTVVFGQDYFGNMNSFCLFTDGSMISNDTLFYYGTRNAQK